MNIVVVMILGLIRTFVLGGFFTYTWNIYSQPYGGSTLTFVEGVVFGLVLQVVAGVFRGYGRPSKDTTDDENIAWSILASFSSSVAIALTWALVAFLSLLG